MIVGAGTLETVMAVVVSELSLVVTLASQSSSAARLYVVPPVELAPALFMNRLAAALSVASSVIENAVLELAAPSGVPVSV